MPPSQNDRRPDRGETLSAVRFRFRRARRSIMVVALLFAGGVTAACSHNSPDLEGQMQGLLERYEDAAREGRSRIASAADEGIIHLAVTPQGAEWPSVSADLRRASIEEVIDRILRDTSTPYVLSVRPRGRVTARFSSIPLLSALNLVLRGTGYSAELENGVIAVDERAPEHAPAHTIVPPPQPPAPSPMYAPPTTGSATTQERIPLRWLDTRSAVALVAGLYLAPPGQVPAVRVSSEPNANAVVLTGSRDDVARARAAVAAADRAPEHVLIEVLVVELSWEEVQRISLDIVNAAKGALSNINLRFGELGSPALTFTSVDGLRAPLSFTAVVELLEQEERARVVSRPYLATLSGVPAVLTITNERVILPHAPAGSFSQAYHVESGVTLRILPIVTADGAIRAEIDVEESQFIPTAANIAAEKDKNGAKTTMLVGDGQSIIIGGLRVDRNTRSNAGVPLLRKVPLLNYLFGNQERSQLDQEVVIVITPHLYSPGVTIPISAPSATAPRGARQRQPGR